MVDYTARDSHCWQTVKRCSYRSRTIPCPCSCGEKGGATNPIGWVGRGARKQERSIEAVPIPAARVGVVIVGAEECHLSDRLDVWDRMQGLILRFGLTGLFCSELVARLDVAPRKTPRSAAWRGGGFCAVSVSEARSTCRFALGQ